MPLFWLHRERETLYHANNYPAEPIQTATSGHEIFDALESLGKNDHHSSSENGASVIFSLLGRFARFGRHGRRR
jgi:hypothetical protein